MKKLSFSLLALALAALILVGCGSAEEAADGTAMSKAALQETASTGAAAGKASADSMMKPVARDTSFRSTGSAVLKPVANSALANRSVIRKAELGVRVPSIEKAEKEVGKIVAAAGGYVDSTSSTDLATDKPMMKMTLKVAVSTFEDSIGKIEGLGIRLSKSVKSEDVTTEVVDVDARVESLRGQIESYRKTIKTHRDTADAIGAQQSLDIAKGEIASLLAQKKTLSEQTSLSDINLTLEQDAPTIAASTDPNWFAQSWNSATSTMGGFFRLMATCGIWLLVSAPFWIPVALLVRYAIRSEQAARNRSA